MLSQLVYLVYRLIVVLHKAAQSLHFFVVVYHASCKVLGRHSKLVYDFVLE